MTEEKKSGGSVREGREGRQGGGRDKRGGPGGRNKKRGQKSGRGSGGRGGARGPVDTSEMKNHPAASLGDAISPEMVEELKKRGLLK